MKSLSYVLTLGLLLGGVSMASAQEKSKSSGKDDSKSTASSRRERGQLPQNYRRLGLSDEQTQQIYKIQNEYADKIRDMEAQIEKLKGERNTKYSKVLTKAQHDRLDEIQKGKGGSTGNKSEK